MAFEEDSGADDFEPLEFEENQDDREAIQRDLLDVQLLKGVLGSTGVKGVVVYCPDCESDHYLGWELLANNLQQMLQDGEAPVHEPAWDPNPDEYVTWDYARGFLDGYDSATYGDEDRADVCGFCGGGLPEGGRVDYCPHCGAAQGPVRLVKKLKREGWSAERISALLEQCGFEMPLFDGERLDGERPPAED